MDNILKKLNADEKTQIHRYAHINLYVLAKALRLGKSR